MWFSTGISRIKRAFKWLCLKTRQTPQSGQNVHRFQVRTPICHIVPVSRAYGYIYPPPPNSPYTPLAPPSPSPGIPPPPLAFSVKPPPPAEEKGAGGQGPGVGGGGAEAPFTAKTSPFFGENALEPHSVGKLDVGNLAFSNTADRSRLSLGPASHVVLYFTA